MGPKCQNGMATSKSMIISSVYAASVDQRIRLDLCHSPKLSTGPYEIGVSQKAASSAAALNVRWLDYHGGVHDLVKDAFSEGQHTSVKMIEKAILLLEGRLTNLKELPIHAFYLFEEPNLGSEEAIEMVNALDPQDRELVLSSVCKALSEVSEPWEDQDILKVLHDTRKEIKVLTKVFMKTLIHALTGFKEGPAIHDIIKVLGPARSLDRLKGILNN
ncbi:hypothetical protein EST38_g11574 [Candolleomyces aberdarensis]|uniref:Aminoacyl-tRNA synthetase class I anticodon-binding domain-containing protein n=1 Tax=Candolleomyces aberdarensis TaxID=2316362 RepID=A0A4V1Q292_9AGAR|nr:hypothetical protein EST38_g11574 [Candolleomyces aberdarensis]